MDKKDAAQPEHAEPGLVAAGENPTEHADPPHPMDLLVERWWQSHFPGSVIAASTPAWNAAYAAKETLKRLLTAKGD